MRKFTPSDYRVMPWKNGGGITTELYVEPAAEAGFLWRVSIADVAAEGPFSTFAGYDRHIMALEGCGMVLEGGPNGGINIDAKFVPQRFSGDWHITSRLISGPVRDFNLMARREAVESHLECMEISAPCVLGRSEGETTFAYLLGGEVDAGQRLGKGDSLLLFPGEAVDAVPLSYPMARVAVCRIKPKT